jgi:hypothetical protein
MSDDVCIGRGIAGVLEGGAAAHGPGHTFRSAMIAASGGAYSSGIAGAVEGWGGSFAQARGFCRLVSFLIHRETPSWRVDRIRTDRPKFQATVLALPPVEKNAANALASTRARFLQDRLTVVSDFPQLGQTGRWYNIAVPTSLAGGDASQIILPVSRGRWRGGGARPHSLRLSTRRGFCLGPSR